VRSRYVCVGYKAAYNARQNIEQSSETKKSRDVKNKTIDIFALLLVIFNLFCKYFTDKISFLHFHICSTFISHFCKRLLWYKLWLNILYVG